MAVLPKEHNELYFDKLIRTQKAESLLALIMASYYGHKSSNNDPKEEIAKRLQAAYDLFRNNVKGRDSGSGTYIGTPDQFQSQYTMGHEMAIWKDPDLNLTEFASRVATNDITVKQYLDVVFLNYIQPINKIIIHPLYKILIYFKTNDVREINKDKIQNCLGVDCSTESKNSLFNWLIGTDFFDTDNNALILNSKFDLDDLLARCNKEYLGEDGYTKAMSELNDRIQYEKYISTNVDYIMEKTDFLSESFDLSEGELAIKLAENVSKAIGNNDKALSIHLFGIKYGKTIRERKYNVKNIIVKAKLSETWNAELNKGIKLSNYVGMINNCENQEQIFEDCYKQETFSFSVSNKDGTNLIVYGTPGCGKSYYIEHTLLKDYRHDDNNLCIDSIRTTFYQDYTNTDFVGQIMPVVKNDGSVTYEFNPGPFTLALNKAIQNPDRPIALVIEELNRGNAPSIFGDIFQLLDRRDGTSVYNITNVNIQKYLEDENPNYKFDYIKLPSNLSIFATMNTSDQNVFTLDTAFKRRWKFEKLKNSFNDDHPYSSKLIPGMDIDWKRFCESINNLILESKDEITNSEDKQIGVYFVEENMLRMENVKSIELQRKEFAYKLFEYLWDDVFKYSRDTLFKGAKSLDDLIDRYVKQGEDDTNGICVFAENVFKKDS